MLWQRLVGMEVQGLVASSTRSFASLCIRDCPSL